MIALTRVTAANPDFSSDLDWLGRVYAHAISEELALSPAGALRRVAPDGGRELGLALKSILADPQRAFLLIARQGGERAGYFLGLVKDCVGEDPDRCGYVNGLYVLPQYRRQGLAQTLLNEGMGWFKGLGLKSVELYIAIRNEAARNFWGKNGYLACEEVLIKGI